MKIGVIGIGRWGSIVLNKYKNLEKAGSIDKVYSCDIRGGFDTDNIEDLLGMVDGVHICVPTIHHYDIAKYFLTNKINCLVEKPITDDIQKAKELIKISEKNNLILQAGYVLRFDNVTNKAKEMIGFNEIGNINSIEITWTDYRPDVIGNIILELMPHPIDAIYDITGKLPKEYVILNYDRLVSIQMEYLEFPVTAKLSWMTKRKNHLITIDGERGVFDFEYVGQKINGKHIPQNDAITDEALNFIESMKSGMSINNTCENALENLKVIKRMTQF